MAAEARLPPLIAHILYRFDTGGLENGLVNLLNRLPAGAYRHAVIALTEVTDFRDRVRRDDVEYVALHKPPGQGLWLYPRMLSLLRRLQPRIVHTRNLAALEMQLPAVLARAPVRIHGEHGRDVDDLDGSSRKHQWMRRLYRPFVQQYVAVSGDLAQYLELRVGVPAQRIAHICNGVDTDRFAPATGGRTPIPGCPFIDPGLWLFGSVGRMQAVKGQTVLARAFVQALAADPGLRTRMRLVLVGAGPLQAECASILEAGGVRDLAWLPGERADVPDVMRGLDCFVLPSLAEGISNTILEAMASGLPVLATRVGGNAELVTQDSTGWLVPADDAVALAQALLRVAAMPQQASALGRSARADAERRFSLAAMVGAYGALYDRLLAQAQTDR